MSAAAQQWVQVRRKGDVGGAVYVAHRVAGGWRYGEKTGDRFPAWEVLPEAEFWRLFEMFH